jgi:hypothetical protein
LGKKILRTIFLSAFLIISFFFSGSEATLLENIPLDSWVYSTINELYSQGLSAKLHRNVRPYTRGEIASCVLEMNLRQKKHELELTDSQLWLLEKLNQEFCFEIEELYQERYEKDENHYILKYGAGPLLFAKAAGEDTSYGRLQAKFETALQFDRRLVFKDRVILDTKAEKERAYWGREWKGDLTGILDMAYAQIDLRYFYLLLGRDHLRWGPGKEDVLLLTDQIPPFDMLKLEGQLGSFRFVYFSTVLDQIWVPAGEESGKPSRSFFARRYLSGHRINLKLKFGLEMGISEVILYGGEHRSLEPYYLNPLLPYYGEQYNQDQDDNALWSFDVALTWFKNKEFYAEILLDDFQYDFESEPQQTGFQIGLNHAEIFGLKRSFAHLEYTKINNWVYGQNKLWNTYTYHGFGMGSILGPDADRFFFRFIHHLNKDLELSFSEEYRRKGEGAIETPQTSAVPYPKKFPSGIVEYSNQIRFEASYQPSAHFKLDWAWGLRRVRNFQNISGHKADDFFLEGSLELHLWKERKY